MLQVTLITRNDTVERFHLILQALIKKQKEPRLWLILKLRHLYSPHKRNDSIFKLTIFIHIPEDTGRLRIFLKPH